MKISNELVSFAFDSSTGSLVGIEDLLNGFKHIQDQARGRLFRVMCPNRLWRSRYADSQDSGPPVIDASDHLTMAWDRLRTPHDPAEVSARVEVRLEDGIPEAIFTIELENRSSDRLHEVRFPWVGGWTGLAGEGSDRGMCGVVPVDLHARPQILSFTLGGRHSRRHYVYTYEMLLPFLDVSGGGGGLSYICYQERPNLGGIVIEDLDPEPDMSSMSWSWVHYPFTKGGERWRSPPIGIGVHQGDWHRTADRFRSWVEDWWRPPPGPEDLPTKIGFQSIQLRGLDGKPFHRFTDIPRLAESGKRFDVGDLCLWDPIAGAYLRPDDGDLWMEFDDSQSIAELRSGLARARELGVNTSTLVNLRLIRLNSSLYARIGEEMVQRTIYGVPIYEDWSNCSYDHASFRTKYLSQISLALCQRPPSFRRRAMRIVQGTMELGFTSLFIDQSFDGNPCFSEGHGHRSPDDTHESAIEWIAKAADWVRSRSPDSYVIGESTDLYAMGHINVIWNWGWASLAPEVMRYAMPDTIHCWIVDRQPEVLNRAFAMGFLIAFNTHQAERTLDDYPAFGRRVAQLSALRRTCADYVATGRFLDDLGLDLQGCLGFVYGSGPGLAVVFAETRGKPGQVTAILNPDTHGRKPTDPGTLVRQDGTSTSAGEILADGKVEIEFHLDPLEVAIWMVPCTRP